MKAEVPQSPNFSPSLNATNRVPKDISTVPRAPEHTIYRHYLYSRMVNPL